MEIRNIIRLKYLIRNKKRKVLKKLLMNKRFYKTDFFCLLSI